MRRMKRRIYGLLMSAIVLSQLTGCGKTTENIDQFGEGGSIQVVADKDKDANAQENPFGIKGTEIPEHITCSIDKNATEGHKSLDIDADVTSFGYDSARVYRVDHKMLTDEEVKAFADSFFGEGNYENVLPYDLWKKEEIEAEYERFEKMVEDAGDGYAIPKEIKLGLEVLMFHPVEGIDTPRKPEEGKFLYRGMILCADDVIMDQYFVSLRGTVDGLEYQFNFSKDVNGDRQRISIIPLYPVQNVVVDASRDTVEEDEHPETEQLTKKANELVGKLTDDYVLVSSQGRYSVDVETNEIVYDGEYLQYALKYSELSPSLCGTMCLGQGVGASEANEFSEIEQVALLVELDKNGNIMKLVQDSSDVVGEPVGEATQLLTFADAMSSVDHFLENLNDSDNIIFPWTRITIADIRLSYLKVYSDHELVYMPYWVFLSNENMNRVEMDASGSDKTPILAVNAIDGSCVAFEAVY